MAVRTEVVSDPTVMSGDPVVRTRSSLSISSLSPHPPHAGSDIHLGSSAGGACRGTRGRKRSSCPLEQSEQFLGNEARSGGIEVSTALRVLAVDEEALRYDQMKAVLCAGHGDVEQVTFSSISADVPAPRSDGMQPSTTFSR